MTESQYLSEVERELNERFAPKRAAADVLAASYKRLGKGFESKAARCKDCGTCLGWSPSEPFDQPPARQACLTGGGGQGQTGIKPKMRLVQANFCKDRLCPMCSWRRTLKIYSQASKIMTRLGDDYRYLFLTLTVPNCKGQDLAKTVDLLENAWRNMAVKSRKTAISKRFNGSVCGWFKALEITHNMEPYKYRYVKDSEGKKHKQWIWDDFGHPIANPSYDTYHPHFHTILAVKPSYFTYDYIKHDEWLDIWRTATGIPDVTQVDIRVCKSKEDYKQGEKAVNGITDTVKSLSSAVCELIKYPVKGSHYLGKYDDAGALIKPFPNKVIDDAVFTLSGAMKNRRLVEFGGCFRKAASSLGLDDMEDGDLLHYGGSDLRPDVARMIYYYSWSSGTYKFRKKDIITPAVDVLVSADDDIEEFE